MCVCGRQEGVVGRGRREKKKKKPPPKPLDWSFGHAPLRMWLGWEGQGGWRKESVHTTKRLHNCAENGLKRCPVPALHPDDRKSFPRLLQQQQGPSAHSLFLALEEGDAFLDATSTHLSIPPMLSSSVRSDQARHTERETFPKKKQKWRLWQKKEMCVVCVEWHHPGATHVFILCTHLFVCV